MLSIRSMLYRADYFGTEPIGDSLLSTVRKSCAGHWHAGNRFALHPPMPDAICLFFKIKKTRRAIALSYECLAEGLFHLYLINAWRLGS